MTSSLPGHVQKLTMRHTVGGVSVMMVLYSVVLFLFFVSHIGCILLFNMRRHEASKRGLRQRVLLVPCTDTACPCSACGRGTGSEVTSGADSPVHSTPRWCQVRTPHLPSRQPQRSQHSSNSSPFLPPIPKEPQKISSFALFFLPLSLFSSRDTPPSWSPYLSLC